MMACELKRGATYSYHGKVAIYIGQTRRGQFAFEVLSTYGPFSVTIGPRRLNQEIQRYVLQ